AWGPVGFPGGAHGPPTRHATRTTGSQACFVAHGRRLGGAHLASRGPWVHSGLVEGRAAAEPLAPVGYAAGSTSNRSLNLSVRSRSCSSSTYRPGRTPFTSTGAVPLTVSRATSSARSASTARSCTESSLVSDPETRSAIATSSSP